MRFHLRFRFLPMLMLLVFAGVAATAAFATPPTDQGPFPLSSVADCTTADHGHGGASICKVRALAGGNWQAATGEWIVIRGAIGEPDLATCQADQASIVATITLDGSNLPVDVIPCAFDSGSGLWFVDYRALSHPLPKGDHAIVETLTWTTAVDGTPAGSTVVGTDTLTVAKG